MRQQFRPALVSVLVFTVLTGLLFPAIVTVTARTLFPYQANGSLIVHDGHVVGSELIGQSFAAPAYFHPRPSANSYAGDNSGGTNLAMTSDKLIHGIHKKTPDGKDDPGNFEGIADLRKKYLEENGLPTGTPLPADALTRSASGLDPDISPANAALQAARVAKARAISVEQVKQHIAENTVGRQLGLLGEPRVNVLKLNLALDGHK